VIVTANKRFRIGTAYAISGPERLPVFADALSSIEESVSILCGALSLVKRLTAFWLICRMRATVSQREIPKGETLMNKRIIHAVAALFLVLVATPLFAVQRNVVDEVIRMSKAGVAEDAILEYIEKTDARIVVTGDDVIAMTEANVSKNVLKAVVDAGAERRDSRSYRDRSYVSPRVVVASPYYYDPYYYYDPFWYRPSFSLNFGFGGYYGYRGGHFGGGGSRGGHRGHR
jgi:hypothetical protein